MPLWVKTDENTLLNADCIQMFSYFENKQKLVIRTNLKYDDETIEGVTKVMWHDIITALAAQRSGRYPNVISIPHIMETRRNSDASEEWTKERV